MKRLDVILSPLVKNQIDTQFVYIAQSEYDNAVAWEDRLCAAIEDIGEMHGHAIDEDASTRVGYPVRKCVFEGTYLIHYRIDAVAGAIHIINFRLGARLPERGEP